MSVKAGASNLEQSAKDLAAQWQEARVHWRDAKALEFEHRYLAALPQQLAKTTAVMDDLDALLRRIRRDCE